MLSYSKADTPLAKPNHSAFPIIATEFASCNKDVPKIRRKPVRPRAAPVFGIKSAIRN